MPFWGKRLLRNDFCWRWSAAGVEGEGSADEDVHAGGKRGFVDVEAFVMVAGGEGGADEAVGGLAAVVLHALHEEGGVFRAEGVAVLGADVREVGRVCGYAGEGLCKRDAGLAGDGLAYEGDAAVHVIHVRGAFEDAAGLCFDVVVDGGAGAAGFDTEPGVAGDDVASAAGVQFADVDARGAVAVAGDGVDVECGAGGGEQGVFAFVRRAAGMCGGAAEFGVEFAGGEKAAGAGDEVALRDADAEVQGDEVIGVIDDAGFHHGFGAAHAFFGALEDETQGAGELFMMGGDEGGKAKADAGVAVVCAGVHAAGVARAEALLGGEVRGVVAF